MTYFRPHFMMPPSNEAPWLSYDQALNLQSPQQNNVNAVNLQHKPIPIKHEQVDQARYGFDQINYSGGQPSSLKVEKKTEETPQQIKFNCDQCDYQATQKSSLNRHKQTQHEGIKQPSMAQLNGKTFDCDLCGYQATQLASLKRHKMAKHSGTQFRCDQCEYIGTTELNLKLHKRSKHEGVRFPCDVCGYEATQPGVLKRHKIQKHGYQPPVNQQRTHHNQVVRPPRDPNAPKRPLSGFFHFSNIGRAKVKAANPDWTVGDISKELSRRWHALDDITRDMFEQMADEDKQRFRNEKAEYNMSPKGGYKQTRAKKDPAAPKRPLCGFMYFSSEERANVRLENPNFHVGEIGKELGRRWAEADPEVREKYNNMAIADKERFLIEKNDYLCSPRARNWRGKRAKKDPNAPKRNQNGFIWFSHEERNKIRDQYPGMRVGDCAKELSRRWALADPETKARYDQMAYQDKQRYEKEKHEWHMKQRQSEMEQPRMVRMEGPGYTVTPKWEGQNQQPSGGPLPITHHAASPPTYVHATSPPAIINHQFTPPPTVRYGY